MGIFQNILEQLHPSAEKNDAWSISRRLFNDACIEAADIDTLIALGDEAIEPFRSILADDGDCHGQTRRQQIVDMLGSIDQHHPSPENIIALLASFIDEDNGMVGANAIAYLASLGLRASHASQITPLLLKALQSNNPRTRSYAAEALGKHADTQTIAPLCYALSDPNWLVRECVSSALACFDSAVIMPQLSQLMGDHDHHIRLQTVHTLINIDHTQALALLISALDDSHAEVQWEAIAALASRHPRDAMTPLLAHYQQGDKALRQRIITACGNIGIKRVATYLSHSDTGTRITVADILGQYGDEQLLPLLADAWQHENKHEVQMWIIIAMTQLAAKAGDSTPEVAINIFIRAAASPHEDMSFHATKALESLKHPLAEQFIQAPLQQTKVAITCPSCLQALQLTPPLTEKEWSCQHCHLGFTIHAGLDGRLVVTPYSTSRPSTPSLSHDATWFDVLQVSPEADIVMIKRAFRTLLKQYHPDKVTTLGTEFKHLAEEKTRLLTWALRSGLKQRELEK